MCKSFSKRVLSVSICFALLATTLVYADTVVVGVAPGNEAKNMSANATTTYLQNQFTGPGTMPNSSVTNTTPIQGVSVDYSVGQALSNIDSNNAESKGPTTTNISSPAANNAAMAALTSTAKVITNGLNQRGADDRSSDSGPTVQEISGPTADTSLTSSNYGPGASSSYNTTTTTRNEIPSYTTKKTTQTTTQQATTTYTTSNTGAIIYTVNNNIQAVKPNITAPAALVVNATTRQIYFSKGGLNPYHPAALTNLVTASILLSYKRLDDVLAVSQTAVTGLESGASTAGLKAGDVITVRDALGAMFVRSCCDVANVVAENVAGSIPNFVALMNQTVKNWGCVATNFANPTGLNNTAQVTTTYDAAIIMDKVSSDPTLKLMLQQQSYVLPATAHRGTKTLTTTNQLLIPGNKNHYAGISASKMGYTSKAKYTIASELDYNGQRIVAVVLSANGSQFTDSTKLLNFAKVASLESVAAGASYNTVLNVSSNVSTQAMAAANVAATTSLPIANVTSNTATVAANSSLIASTGDTAGTWQKDAKGWFFIKANGQSASNEWIKQGGKVYCVDSAGYMITGWKFVGILSAALSQETQFRNMYFVFYMNSW